MVSSSYVRKLRFNDVGFWFLIVRYFVLLNNCVTLGLQKHVFLIKSDIRDFFVRSGDVWKVRHNYLTSWFVNLLYLFLRQNYVINAFLTMTYYVPLWYIALRMEITYGNYVSFLLVIVTFFLFRHICIIYLFDVITTLHFGPFKLRTEMTWKLRLVFVRHFNVLFITSQLRYLFVRCNYVFWWR